MKTGVDRPRAFTLTELIVVIGLIVLLLAIAVPSFSAMVRSSDRTLAESQLRVALATARDLAISAGAGHGGSGRGDAAAVFFFDQGGRVRVVPCIQVGTLNDWVRLSLGNDPRNRIERDIFVPAPLVEPVRIPRGWSVRGYAPAGTLDTGRIFTWNGWYEPNNDRRFDVNRGNWVFPETDFFNPAGVGLDGAAAAPGDDPALAQAGGVDSSGSNRQTFMVRFEAGTGNLAIASRGQALVVAPSTAVGFRSTRAPYRDYRIDRAADPEQFVRQILAPRPDFSNDINGMTKRMNLIGDESVDTVLVRPVTELALYDERLLAAGVGATAVNPATGTLYGTRNRSRSWPTSPTYDLSLFRVPQPNGLELTNRVNDWIEGRPITALGNRQVPSEARLFVLQRGGGQLREVTQQ
ncbi:MAG: type II secretion system protein [Phycisphaerae bacterium]|nr:type II secretion system protein [Phycisphaerae bacterium]